MRRSCLRDVGARPLRRRIDRIGRAAASIAKVACTLGFGQLPERLFDVRLTGSTDIPGLLELFGSLALELISHVHLLAGRTVLANETFPGHAVR
jgi:hypothetical protein